MWAVPRQTVLDGSHWILTVNTVKLMLQKDLMNRIIMKTTKNVRVPEVTQRSSSAFSSSSVRIQHGDVTSSRCQRNRPQPQQQKSPVGTRANHNHNHCTRNCTQCREADIFAQRQTGTSHKLNPEVLLLLLSGRRLWCWSCWRRCAWFEEDTRSFCLRLTTSKL